MSASIERLEQASATASSAYDAAAAIADRAYADVLAAGADVTPDLIAAYKAACDASDAAGRAYDAASDAEWAGRRRIAQRERLDAGITWHVIGYSECHDGYSKCEPRASRDRGAYLRGWHHALIDMHRA